MKSLFSTKSLFFPFTSLVQNLTSPMENTVEPVWKDHPIGHKNVVRQDRWSLVTGSVVLKCGSFCQKCVVCQDRWSLMAVVSQDRFHCIQLLCIIHKYYSIILPKCFTLDNPRFCYWLKNWLVSLCNIKT